MPIAPKILAVSTLFAVIVLSSGCTYYPLGRYGPYVGPPFRYGPYPIDRNDNPPGPIGGPGTNWENPPGPRGGPGASPNRRRWWW